jgi:hypothetical protein
MRGRTVVWFLLLGLALVGCVSIPRATPENDTLVVGRFNLVRDESRNKQFNGTYSAGIRLTFRCVEDDRMFKISTQPGGWFFLSNLTEGIYELTELYYIKESSNTRYIFDPKIERCFVVKRGKVNNLGLVKLVYEDRGLHLEDSQEYGAIQAEFQTQYAESNWNDEAWADTKLRLGPRTIDNHHFIQEEVVDADDSARFYWLWIVWNNTAAERQTTAYPVPEDGMSVTEWARRNLDLVSETIITDITTSMTPGDQEGSQFTAIIGENAKILNNYLLFNYEITNTGATESIMIAW